ncbi:MAG: TonB-dependent receptor [Carboxylicivirga sp.]|jgi:hypothetical protein|nr:TonB-dependent receptor [Carboxylicivirga sp.]
MKYGIRGSSSGTGNKLILLCLFILLSTYAGHARHFVFKFNATPVSTALRQVADSFDIKISFDADRLKQVSVSKFFQTQSPANAILEVLGTTDYTFTVRYDTYLIVRREKDTEGVYVTGIITDGDSGERLPYATMLFKTENKLESSTVDGNFNMKMQENEASLIQIKYIGYEDVDTVIVPHGKEHFLNLKMRRKHQALKSVTVKSQNIDMINVSSKAGHFQFNPSRFEDMPNYGETDVFKALQSMPGINARESSSELNIRGSAADQNLVLLDGMTLYNLDHFFGVFSAINPYVVKNIQVYRGGFDARYGERISGIVDIVTKSGTKLKPRFDGGINMMSANLVADIPLSQKFTLVAAARRAYSDVFSSWMVDEILKDKLVDEILTDKMDDKILENSAKKEQKSVYYFGDFNTRLTFTPSSQESFSLSLYGSVDDFKSKSDIQQLPINLKVTDENRWGNYGGTLTWNRRHSGNYFSILQIGHSGYFNNYDSKGYYTKTDLNPAKESQREITETTTTTHALLKPGRLLLRDNTSIKEDNRLDDYFISFNNYINIGNVHGVELGWMSKHYKFAMYKDANRGVIYDNNNSSAFLHTLYLLDKVKLNKALDINIGGRTSYYTQTRKYYLEPRLNVTFKATENLGLKAAFGRYYQFMNKSVSANAFGYNRDFWVLANEDNHKVASSYHYIVGGVYKKNRLTLDIEFYLKDLDGLQEYVFSAKDVSERMQQSPIEAISAGPLSKFINGSGKAHGLDILVQYQFKNFTTWLAYSYCKSKQKFDEINGGDEIPSLHEQKHAVKWSGIYRHKRWNFSALALYNSGQPYIQKVTRDEQLNTMRTYEYLPDYYRIDLSVNRTFDIGKVQIKPGLSILNVLNRENYLDAYQRSFDLSADTPTIQQTSLVKAQDLTFNFYLNFSF